MPSMDDIETRRIIEGNRLSAENDRKRAAEARAAREKLDAMATEVLNDPAPRPTNRRYVEGSNRWEGNHPNDGNGYNDTFRGSPDNLGGPPDGQGGPEREAPADLTEEDIIELRQQAREREEARRSMAARAALANQSSTPDQAAEAMQLADEFGVNRAEVEIDVSAARMRRFAERVDAYSATAPRLRNWLDDPNNLAIAHDDETLGFWEQAGKLLSQSGQVLTKAVPADWEAQIAGLLQKAIEQPVGASQPGDLTFSFSKSGVDVSLDMEGGKGGVAASDFIEFQDKDGGNAILSWAGAASKRADEAMPEAGNILSDSWLAALRSGGSMMPGLVAAVVTRNAAVSTAMMGGQTGGQSYARARAEGLDAAGARRYADVDAMAEMAFEAIPGMMLIDDIVKKTPLGKAILRQLVTEVPGEVATGEIQALNEWTTLNPEKPVAEYFAERPEAILKTVLSTVIMSGGMTTAAKGVDIAADAVNEQRRIEGARQRQRMFQALGEAAGESKLKKRLPKKYREFVDQATKDGPLETVSIPADQFDAYFQSKQIDPREWAAALEVPVEVYEEALLRGDDITIPMGIFAEKIAGGEHDAGLVPHMRLSPNDFTAFEAEQKAGEFEAVFGEELKRFQDAQEMSADLAESETRVLEAVTESLKATGVYENRAVVPANAAVMAAMVTTLGKRTGEDPMAIWEAYGPQVRGMVGSEMTGLELSQTAMADLIKPKGFKTGFGDSDGRGGKREFEPRDVVMAYNDGDSQTDMVIDFGLDERENAQGLMRLLAFNVREAVRTAIEQGQTEALAKAWNVTPDELERFSKPRDVSKTNTISDETLRLIELAAQGLKNKEIAERLGKTPDQVKALKSQRKGLIEARRAEIVAKRAGQELNQTLQGGTPEAMERARKWGEGYQVFDAYKGMYPYDWTKEAAKPAFIKVNGRTVQNPDVGNPLRHSGVPIEEINAPSSPWAGFFSDSPEVASRFAKAFGGEKDASGIVVPAKLRFSNPVTIDAGGKSAAAFQFDSVAREQGSEDLLAAYRAALADPNVDGIIVKNTKDEGTVYIPKDPKNIRSRFAAFDPAESDSANLLAQEKRGAFLRMPGQRSEIRLFEARDLSTFMHEASHWYLDLLVQMGQGANPHPFVTEQLAAVAKWKGLDALPPIWGEDGKITDGWREVQESFAETFEAYLREGKAPSRDLRDVFASFRQWLLSLYKSIRNIGSRVDLTPEIKGVFDRMLATDEAMAEASAGIEADAEALAKAMFDKGAIKTEAELERIKKRLATEREQATAEMSADLIRRFMATQKAKYLEDRRKVRNEAIIAVDQRPEQRALAYLSRGEWLGDVVVAKELGLEYYEQRAAELGYRGNDLGEAVGWIAAAERGLPMDRDSRMARAAEQGFDTSRMFYRGQDGEIVREAPDGSYGPGVSVADDPMVAEEFAEGDNAIIMPVLVRGRIFEIDDAYGERLTNPRTAGAAVQELKEQGYSGVIDPANGFVSVFRALDVRSVNAAFDPEMQAAADLLAQSEVAMRGGTPEAMERARKMGFDVDTPLYHGTSNSNFLEFQARPDVNRSEYGNAVYLTDNPEIANDYAKSTGFGAFDEATRAGSDQPSSSVLPVFARLKDMLDVTYDEVKLRGMSPRSFMEQSIKNAREQGKPGVIVRNIPDPDFQNVYVVFDPKNIRGRFAAFDPAKSDSANLLAQSNALVSLSASEADLKALTMQAAVSGKSPVLRLFKTDTGRIIAWPADDMTHAEARDDLKLGDMRMQHGMIRFGQTLRDVSWYDTTGSAADDGQSLAQGGPRMIGGTPEAMARAKAQGWHVDMPLYHGTSKDFQAFKPSDDGVLGPGVYLTEYPHEANKYARGYMREPAEGRSIIPVFVRGRLADATDLSRATRAANDDVKRTAEILRADGFSGIAVGGHVVIFDPKDIRARFAAFDPAESDSAYMLAQSGDRPELDALGFFSAVQEAAKRVPDTIWGMGWPAARNAIMKGRGTSRPTFEEMDRLGVDDAVAELQAGRAEPLRGAELKAAVTQIIAANRIMMGRVDAVFDPAKRRATLRKMNKAQLWEALTPYDKSHIARNFIISSREGNATTYRMQTSKEEVSVFVVRDADLTLGYSGEGPRLNSVDVVVKQRDISTQKLTEHSTITVNVRGTISQGEDAAKSWYLQSAIKDHLGAIFLDLAPEMVRNRVTREEMLDYVATNAFGNSGSVDPRMDPGDYDLDEAAKSGETRMLLPENLRDALTGSTHSGEEGEAINLLWSVRKDDTGKRGLFLRQLQSDEAQQARQEKTEAIKGRDDEIKRLMEYNGYSLKEAEADYEDWIASFDRAMPVLNKTSIWVTAGVRALVFEAAKQNLASVSIPTAATSTTIQGNSKAAQHYETNVRGALEKVARQLGGSVREGTVESENGPATVYTFDLTPEMRSRIRSRGFPLFQSRDSSAPGWGPIPPPPNLPPMRLDLAAVREMHGDDALKRLPPEVVQFSATATDVDQLVNVARDVAASRRGSKPKTMWQFFARRRVIGEGMNKVAYVGIRDPGGEILSMIGEKKAYPGLLAERENDTRTVRSYSIHDAAIAAWEAGYTPGDAPLDDNAFLDLLRQDVDGSQPVYREEDQDRVAALAAADRWASWFDETMSVNVNERNTELLRRQIAASIDPASENKLAPDQAAEILNGALGRPAFRTGEDLLNALSLAQGREKAINEETDRRMREKYGPDPFRDGTVMEMARHYANGEMAQRRGEIELDALSRAAGQPAASRLAKQLAKRQLQAMTVKQVQGYRTFLANERRWMKAAIAATKKGDLREAALHRQRALVNQQLYYEGEKLAERLDRNRRELQTYETQKGRRARIAKDYLEQIDGMLDRYELRVSKLTQAQRDKAVSAAAWVQKMKDAGREAEIAPEAELLAEQADMKPWTQLRIDEVDWLLVTIRNIAHLGRTKESLLRAKEKREFGALIGDLVSTLGKVRNPNPKLEQSFSKTPWEGISTSLRKVHASLTRPEYLFNYLDGGPNGALWNALFRPFTEAADMETARSRDAAQAMRALYGVYSPSERVRLFGTRINTPEVNAPGAGLTKMDVIVIGLNWGNADNRTAVAEGYGWEPAQIEAMLNRVLEDRDWTFIEGVWDLIGSFRDDAFDLHEDMTGVRPEAVKADPLTLASGRVIAGGYYPLKYAGDRPTPKSIQQQRQDQTQALSEMGLSFAKPMTRTGHLKARVGSGGKPVQLSIGVLHEHLQNVIHDIAYRRAVVDANRIISAPDFQQAFIQAAGREQYDILRPWIASVATEKQDENTGVLGSILRRTRKNVAITWMGYKLGTAVQQLTGFVPAATELGAGWMMRGISKSLVRPTSLYGAWQFVSGKSEFMRDRIQGYDRDVRSVTAELAAPARAAAPLAAIPGLRETAGALAGTTAAVQRNAFILISMMDMAVSVPTWIGAYDKAMAGKVKGVPAAQEEDAIAFADALVRKTQTAGKAQDLPDIMRGSEWKKLFTILFGYFSGLYNLTSYDNVLSRFRSGGVAGKAAFMANMMLLFVIVPVLTEILAGRFAPDEDDGEDWGNEEWLKRQGTSVGLNLMSPIPFVRDIASAKFRPYSDYQLSPVGGAINTIIRSTDQIPDTDYEMKQAANSIGYLFGLPAAQLWITGDYLYEWLATEEEDPFADPVDAGREALLTDRR